MGTSLPSPAVPRQRISLEDVRTKQAKADFKNVEGRDFRAEIGGAIQRAFSVAGLSQKEVAAQIGVDTAQVARWIAGTERPQMDRLFALEAVRWPLIQSLATLDEQVELHIQIRRRA